MIQFGTQVAVLRGLMKRAAGTEWGKRYGFSEIAEAKDARSMFRERVAYSLLRGFPV